jgi:radical SAM protein with 4Fe4S-binding SPASM domain
MITKSPTFCPAPWTSLNIDQTGRVSCCMFGEQSIGNIKQNSIQEIIQGPALQDIKQTMAQGQWHSNCVQCRRNEDVTGASARTVRTAPKETLDSIDHDMTWFAPEHLVINWSNLCNLTCTYCNADASTSWQAIKGIPINHVKNKHADLIQMARELGHHVQGLTLGGGEPLLQKGLVEFLQCLNANQVRVLVTTNLSINLLNNPVYQELRKWPTVDWQISFDNANARQFEYVRRGADWQTFVNNIRIMKQDGQRVIAHPAYSVYCAYDLVSYYEFCVEHDLNLFWCDLTHPWDLDVRRLSYPLRQQAQQEIDRVTDQFSHHTGMAIDTLQRYRIQLEDNSNLINIDTYRADPIGHANCIEQELKISNTFEELWPEVVKKLKAHWYV